MADSLIFTALHRQLKQRQIVTSNLANLARSIFKKDTTVRYNVLDDENIIKTEHGKVVEVVVEQYQVYVCIEPLKGKVKKPRRVEVSHITGVM